jgi:hypothetical protein
VIRPLQPLGFARYALFGGPAWINRAHTLDGISGATRSTLSMAEIGRVSIALLSRRALAWASIRGGRDASIVAARPRSGLQSWEISLILTESEDEDFANLLNLVCQAAARSGAERIFLRLLQTDPLTDVALQRGFVPCGRELLFSTSRHPRTPSGQGVSPRRRRPNDDYDLFRLYNASAPAVARFVSGMTFDQWQASQERHRGSHREFVHEIDGQIRGWLHTVQRFGSSQLQVSMHPEEETSAAALVEFGLMQLGRAETVCCLVPEYQVVLQRWLAQRDFNITSEYGTLVRSMVAPARKEEAREAATIAST